MNKSDNFLWKAMIWLLAAGLVISLLAGCNDKEELLNLQLEKDKMEQQFLDSLITVNEQHVQELEVLGQQHADEIQRKQNQINARQRVIDKTNAKIDNMLGITETNLTDDELQEELITFFQWWKTLKDGN